MSAVFKRCVFWVLPALLCACAGTVERADDLIAQDEWLKAVLEYRKAAARNPTDVEFRSRLKQTEQKAADFYYQRGMLFLEQNNLDAAIVQFQQGLAAMPEHGKVSQVMNQALLRKEAQSLYEEAQREIEAGKADDGKRLLRRALEANPEHKRAAELLAQQDKAVLDEEASERLVLTSRAPITLNFRQTDMRTAFEFVAKSFGVDIIFDESVKNTPVTLFAKDVTFEQAINLMLTTTKTFYKKIGPNTILLASDSKEKRGQYEDQIVRTFPLSSVKAKEMADILKGLINIRKIIVNEPLNSIVIRDSEDTIKLATKIIEANDRRAAELILEVEILEVNRAKAERLGLDLGSYRVSTSIPSSATIPVAGDIQSAIRNAATLTLPSATFNFYKQDVDAKTLANPKVRVLSGKIAKIHIGDRVPLRAATIQSGTIAGQVTTTYDYKDIGIRLNAEPIVNVDNSVNVKVSLEVSSLGENMGTQTDPAYRIGTRNAETFMMLRDGETAILGGLIRDEDRRTRVKVPLLGDIPAAGMLFTSFDDSRGRTDVLLTVTPRVVRGWDLPNKHVRSFVSGTEERYMSEPLFASLQTHAPQPAKGAATQVITAQPVLPPPVAQPAPATTPEKATSLAANTSAPQNAAVTAPAAPPLPPVLSFSEPAYEAASGTNIDIQLIGENLTGVSAMPLEILYNPQILKYMRAENGEAGGELEVQADEGQGIMRVSLKFSGGSSPAGRAVLAKLQLRGDKPGISYLVYRTPRIEGAGGAQLSAQARASRVVVK